MIESQRNLHSRWLEAVDDDGDGDDDQEEEEKGAQIEMVMEVVMKQVKSQSLSAKKNY